MSSGSTCGAWTSFCFRPSSRPRPTSRSGYPHRVNLPVDIRVGSASVEESSLPLESERGTVVDRARERCGSLDADLLELDELVVRGPLFDVSGDASVVPRDAYETSGRIDWVVRPREYPEARGSTRFSRQSSKR